MTKVGALVVLIVAMALPAKAASGPTSHFTTPDNSVVVNALNQLVHGYSQSTSEAVIGGITITESICIDAECLSPSPIRETSLSCPLIAVRCDWTARPGLLPGRYVIRARAIGSDGYTGPVAQIQVIVV